jgi:hypothetical protein
VLGKDITNYDLRQVQFSTSSPRQRTRTCR